MFLDPNMGIPCDGLHDVDTACHEPATHTAKVEGVDADLCRRHYWELDDECQKLQSFMRTTVEVTR